MQTTNVKQYRQHLAALDRQVTENHDPLLVTGPREGDIIVVAKDDFDGIEESLRILKDKSIMESIYETQLRIAGALPAFKTMEEVFKDVLEG